MFFPPQVMTFQELCVLYMEINMDGGSLGGARLEEPRVGVSGKYFKIAGLK